jgi:deaminated glutathione amidase
VLPEYFACMGQHDTDKLQQREQWGHGPIQDFLAQTALDTGMWLVGGTLPLVCESPDKVRNASMVWNPQGQCVARYDKVHLFVLCNGNEQFDESRVIEPGTQVVQFDMHDRSGTLWRVGLSVCYDLRFPELYRQHASAGAQILLVPSAFTHTTGQAHWELLLRARAVENLCYVLAPGQGGVHTNGRRTWGHTMLLDPWGQVLTQREQNSGVVLGEVDMQRIAQVRTQLPVLQHRIL